MIAVVVSADLSKKQRDSILSTPTVARGLQSTFLDNSAPLKTVSRKVSAPSKKRSSLLAKFPFGHFSRSSTLLLEAGHTSRVRQHSFWSSGFRDRNTEQAAQQHPPLLSLVMCCSHGPHVFRLSDFRTLLHSRALLPFSDNSGPVRHKIKKSPSFTIPAPFCTISSSVVNRHPGPQ